MKISKKAIKQRMERFEKVCRNAGLKLTYQRIEIFREVAQTGDHPDADTVFRRIRERIPMVSLDTVYRTLWMLNDLDLIKTLGPPRERTRFDANLNSHHHFVCIRCGLTRDFYSKELDELKVPQVVKTFGRAGTKQVEIRGVCLECAGKKKPKPNTEKKREES